ncbi:Flp family type IVb pilin [Novosphingobium sp. FKTRR1]|uniref:Flp family type IVb pilin n=1 Tax=Novosphingobium sp. FKTRR1 TaxID=2879118 RepID=UPI001CEFF361|nr:Flp family type IVb pilin [Novosphingobium sp. FKTRR1]
MLRTVKNVLRDDTGATAVEYGLLVGVFALGMVFGLNAFTNQLYNLWHVVEINTVRSMNSH